MCRPQKYTHTDNTIHTHKHIHTLLHSHTYIPTYTHTHTRTHTYPPVHTHIHTPLPPPLKPPLLPPIHTNTMSSSPPETLPIANWSLDDCCQRGQWITLSCILASAVLSALVWHTRVILPFKLLTVFLHEFSHASATWITGGSVEGIEVHTNEGGVTKTRGGLQWIILPAGYIGSCCWGMFFILMGCMNVWTVRVCAGILCLLLLVVLIRYGRNWALICVCVGFLVLTVILWICAEMFKTVWPLRVLLIFVGVLNGLYSIWDMWDDLIRRKEPSSDAYKFALLTHCNSRFCGVLWVTVALCFIAFTVYLILVFPRTGLRW
eukprot:GHVQ01001284.1.p1 GENE.GHVQ01001284.1~~GHVQ01001284.1.p1  ORF type:complete len:354 (+),score=54.26 GHVQ01001284.1:105-1064(+)